jgi:succinate dehydrogenase / fumarate reductase, cytochrome b subunit
MREPPLSPHLQIYRPQLTSMLSICHRMSGVGLSLGLVMLTWFLVALSHGGASYDTFLWFCGSPLGVLMLMGFSAAACFHLCSGIRHLFFDTGSLFDIHHAYIAGYAVLGGSALLTAIIWLSAFSS